MATLVTLPNIYCTPQDVYDYLGSETTQLRLDDHNFATGQLIETTADNPTGSTTLVVTALQYPVLAGSVLSFDGGGNTALQDVQLTQSASVGSTVLSVLALTADIPSESTARDSGVTLALAARLVKATKYATGQIKMYCTPRYNDGDLAQSWSVNRWASVLAGRWICRRRAQPCPKSIEEDSKEVLEEMKMVKFGKLCIEDIGLRTAGWPFLTNVSVDLRYYVAKSRVEPTISDPTPTQYGQYIDWNSALYIETW